ncbi:MAG: tetratricopeptide repeat protein [Chitinispirillaceae bacterium]|nr:tetratricopeptide repeat protein [Chitinispirillaceae bacterium]
MKLITRTLLLLSAVAFNVFAQEEEVIDFPAPPPSPLLLIAHPVDAGTEKNRKKNLWFYALLDAAVRFRFDHGTSLHTIHGATLARYISPVKTGKEKSVPEYGSIASELQVTHLLQNKFEIDYRRKSLTLDLQIDDFIKRAPVVSINISCGMDDMGRVIDSCFFSAFRALAGERLSPEEVRFFLKPSLCVQYRNNKSAGDIVYGESYSGAAVPRRSTEAYGKILALEKSPLFCLWRQGEAALREGLFDQAQSCFREVCGVLPENTSCGVAIARASLGKKDPQTAKYRLTTIVTSQQNPPPAVFSLLGDAYLMSRDTTAALDYYLRERERHGNSTSLQGKIAAASFSLNSLIQAEKEYDSLIAMNKDDYRAHYYLAYVKLKLGKSGESRILLEQVQKHDKGVAFLWEPIGDYYAARQEWKEATDAYTKAHRLSPQEKRIVLKCADAHLSAGNDSLAAEYLVSHFELDRKAHIGSLSKAGHLFEKRKAWTRAAGAYKRYLDEGYPDYEVSLAYARIMYAQKNWKKVLDLLDIHAGSVTATKEVLLMLAEAWCETRQYHAAVPVLASLYAMEPRDRKIVELSAIAAEKTGDLSKAATMYERYLMFPGPADAREVAYHIGILHEKKKLFRRAAERYEINTAQFPDDLRNYEKLVTYYVEGKQPRRLSQVLERMVVRPKCPAAMNKLLAQTYLDLDEKGKAVEMLQTYLAREPKDGSMWLELGRLFFSLKQCDRAITPLKTAASRLSRDAECHAMLGTCYVRQGDCQSAIAPFERAHTLYRKNISVMEQLAACYRKLGQNDRLFTLLKRWAAVDAKRLDIRIELGKILIDKDKTREAIKILSEATTLSPSNPQAKRLLAQARNAQENKSKRPSKRTKK